MLWRPPGYRFTAKELVKALCGEDTDESKLLMAAIYGKVELFADSTAWNGFLWLVMYSGFELGSLKESLPIVWV